MGHTRDSLIQLFLIVEVHLASCLTRGRVYTACLIATANCFPMSSTHSQPVAYTMFCIEQMATGCHH
jgi:hypothetical protein